MAPSWTIYHNPQCSKSRAALARLKESGIEPTVIEYLKNPLHESELKQLISKLASPPAALVRTKEALYKEQKFDLESVEEIVQNLAKHPSLLERPIVIKDDVAVIARPTEELDKLL